MNEPENNSITSTLIFLCIATLIIFGITLFSENFNQTKSNNINNPPNQNK